MVSSFFLSLFSLSENIDFASDEFHINSVIECPAMTEERAKEGAEDECGKSAQIQPPKEVACESTSSRECHRGGRNSQHKHEFRSTAMLSRRRRIQKALHVEHLGYSCSMCDRLRFERDTVHWCLIARFISVGSSEQREVRVLRLQHFLQESELEKDSAFVTHQWIFVFADSRASAIR